MVELDPAPSDAVSRVSFSPSNAQVLVTTWAGSVSVHSSVTGRLETEAGATPAAALDASWLGSGTVAAGGLDGGVRVCALGAPWRVLGRHDGGARCVVPFADNVLVSGGWDASVKVWDVRVGQEGEEGSVSSVEAGGKVYGAASCGEQCVIFITSNRQVRVLDLRKTDAFTHDNVPQALAYQLRGVSANSDGSQYVVGSTEGRVAVEWLDDASRAYSFKCHRLDGLAFPVNTISHNRKYGSFATGGGDGHVSLWDGVARKRIAQYTRCATSISSIDFASDSTLMAVAVSYTFEEGEKDHPPDSVHIRTVQDADIKCSTT